MAKYVVLHEGIGIFCTRKLQIVDKWHKDVLFYLNVLPRPGPSSEMQL